jgi:FtsP/CotA-like multicopper oxidase with cupredoxin domain
VVHNVKLEIMEKNIEVAPSVTQRTWTFNGTVPAPVLGGRVGDTFSITLVNHQSELYFGPLKAGDYSKMTEFAPDAVVFNGHYAQYANRPIQVQHGQRVRIWVLDEGPSENSSFHVVGGIWDTVYKEVPTRFAQVLSPVGRRLST